MNFQALKTELDLPAYSGLTAEEAAALLNDPTVSASKNITTAEIRQYLTIMDYRLEILDSPTDAARKANQALKDFDEFNMSDPYNVAALNVALSALAGEDTLGFSADDTAMVLSFGQTTVSRATELGLSTVKPGDVIYARGIL